MDKLNLEDIKKFPSLNSNITFSHKLYIGNNILYKVYQPKNIDNFQEFLKNREKFVNYLYNCGEINGCVIPMGKIYENNEFIGIFMTYYKYYFNLYHLLSNDIEIAIKLRILKILTLSLKNLHDKNIVHNDLHLGNVITDLVDTKIIDLDESKINNNDNFEKNNDIKNLVIIILSVLYNTDLEDYIPIAEREKNIKKFLSFTSFDIDFKEYIDYLYSKNNDSLSIDNLINFLKKVNVENIEYDNKKLSKI